LCVFHLLLGHYRFFRLQILLNENLPKITSWNVFYYFFHFMTSSESYLCSVERWDYFFFKLCVGILGTAATTGQRWDY
jgi:hypothetical protein